jgi:hypothetical protein
MKTLTIIAIVCFMLIGNVAIAELRDGLILYFPFEDGSGTTVRDDSGNGYDGTIVDDNKTEWTAGKFGGALNFSGQGFGDKDKGERTGRIEVAHDLGDHEALSFSLWFFATRDDDWNYLGDFRPTGSWFARDSGNAIKLNGQGGVPGDQYPRNEWVHLVVLAAADSTTYYINGVQAGDVGGAAARNISTSLHIGSRFSDNESFLSMMDDWAIWNRILSEDEIAQLNEDSVIPVTPGTAVDVAGKLSTTWASIKGAR